MLYPDYCCHLPGFVAMAVFEKLKPVIVFQSVEGS
jgi:hypothetical protein